VGIFFLKKNQIHKQYSPKPLPNVPLTFSTDFYVLEIK
jgi:hypothetical protein